MKSINSRLRRAGAWLLIIAMLLSLQIIPVVATEMPLRSGSALPASAEASLAFNVDFSTNSANDTSASAHQAQTNGTPKLIKDGALEEMVASFDGVGDAYLYKFSNAEYAQMTSAVSMEAKFYCNEIPASGEHDVFSSQQSGGLGIGFWAGQLYVFSKVNGNSVDLPTTIQAKTWYHVVATFDGRAVKLYVNGELVKEQAASGKLTWTSEETAKNFVIGGDSSANNGTEAYFNGRVAFARLYNKALSTEEVESLSKPQTPPASEKNEILYVNFQNNSAEDLSEFKHPVKAVGSPVIQENGEAGKEVAVFNGSYDAYLYTFSDADYAKMKQAVTIETMFYSNEIPSGEHDIFSNQEAGGLGIGFQGGKLTLFSKVAGRAVEPAVEIQPRRWYHAVGTYDGTAMRLYLNGELAAEQAASGEMTWTSYEGAKNFVIGADSAQNNGAQAFFNGSVSFARLYSKSMTTQEIATLYKALDPPMLMVSGNTGPMEINTATSVPVVTSSNGQSVELTDIMVNGKSVLAAEYDVATGKLTPKQLGVYTFTYTLEGGTTRTRTITRECVTEIVDKVSLGLVSADTMAAGSSYSVGVHVRRDDKVIADGISFELKYDPDVMEYVCSQHEKTAGMVTDDGKGTISIQPGSLNLSTDSFKNFSTTRLVRLTFRIKKDAADGKTKLSFANVALSSGNAPAEFKAVGEDKTIQILGFDKLDKNKDGVIGAGDVAMAVSAEEAQTIAAAADIYPYKHVIAITMDGAGVCFRPDKMYYTANSTLPTLTDDPAIMAKRTNVYAMNLFNSIFATSYSGRSETPTISAQNYTSITHGKEYATALQEYQINNGTAAVYYYPDFGKEPPVYPSVFKAINAGQPRRGNKAIVEWAAIGNGIIEPDNGMSIWSDIESGSGSHAMVTLAEFIASDEFQNTAMLYTQSDLMDWHGHVHGFYNDNYYTWLKLFDNYFKDMMDALEKRGSLDDTLVIVNSDHGGCYNSHGGTTDAEYDVQIALGGQTIDSGKRLTGGTNHDIPLLALAALKIAAPDSMDGTADLLTQATLTQEELVRKKRQIETITATLNTATNVVALTLSNVQDGNTIKSIDMVLQLGGQTVKNIRTSGTVVRQTEKDEKLYLTVIYTDTPEVLAEVELSGAAVNAKAEAFMLGTADGHEIYGDLVNKTVHEPVVIRVQGVAVSPETATLEIGERLTLTAVVTPENAENRNVSWSSSNTSAATVENGTVTAAAVGHTVITVTTEDGGYTAACTVTVVLPAAVRDVIEKIDAIDPVTKGSGSAIEAARKAYDALDPVQKKLVSNDQKLFDAEKRYAELTKQDTPDTPASPVGTPAQKPQNENTGSGLPFADVLPGSWYFDGVKYVYSNSLMNGTSADKFSPDAVLTRGMVVTILYRMENEPAVAGGKGFSDVAAGRYYSNAVAWASANGIVDGFTDGTFKPEQAVTREQLAAILSRYARFNGITVFETELPDGAVVSNWAKKDVSWAFAAGILGHDQTANATQNTNRAEVAAAICNYLTKVVK